MEVNLLIKKIHVYNTSIQIFPYTQGECFELEKMFSLWDDTRKRYYPFLYHISNDILYLPKGCSIELIQNTLASKGFLSEVQLMINNCHKCIQFKYKYSMNTPPRDEVQHEIISFLTHQGEYRNNISATQFAVNVDTGKGKTYCTISAIVQKNVRSIIIVNRVTIINMWKTEILQHSIIPEDRIYIIHSSDDIHKMRNGELDYDIFLCSHQLLSLYFGEFGEGALYEAFDNSGIGLKIFDECHTNFKNIAMVDYFTNTKQTIYLSATFNRSQPTERRMYRIYFGSTVKYQYFRTSDEEKHTIYIPCLYRSSPNEYDLKKISSRYGFSSYQFISYALKDEDRKLIRAFNWVMQDAISHEGKILIVIPTKNSIRYLYDYTIENFAHMNKKIGTLFSDNTADENEQVKKDADIIISTIKSSGDAITIYGLRTIICMEPHMSSLITKQLRGRLDRYTPGEDTYFYDLIDVSIPEMSRCYRNHTTIMKTMTKRIDIRRVPI